MTDTNLPFPSGHGSVTVTTKRDRAVKIRHIVPDDAALLVDLFQRLSPETRRLRFLAVRRDVPDAIVWQEAARLAAIDPLVHAALIATVPESGQERAVGVARLAADAEGSPVAEFAIVIRDDYQGEGLGTVLLDLLIQVAMVRGLEQLYGITLAENEGVHRLARKTGLPLEISTSHGETRLVLSLT